MKGYGRRSTKFFANENFFFHRFLTIPRQMQLCEHVKPENQWGLCAYIIFHTKWPPSPVILWVKLGGKPRWLPLNFLYNDVIYPPPPPTHTPIVCIAIHVMLMLSMSQADQLILSRPTFLGNILDNHRCFFFFFFNLFQQMK